MGKDEKSVLGLQEGEITGLHGPTEDIDPTTLFHQQGEEDQLQWKLKRQETIQKRRVKEKNQPKMALHV